MLPKLQILWILQIHPFQCNRINIVRHLIVKVSWETMIENLNDDDGDDEGRRKCYEVNTIYIAIWNMVLNFDPLLMKSFIIFAIQFDNAI